MENNESYRDESGSSADRHIRRAPSQRHLEEFFDRKSGKRRASSTEKAEVASRGYGLDDKHGKRVRIAEEADEHLDESFFELPADHGCQEFEETSFRRRYDTTIPIRRVQSQIDQFVWEENGFTSAIMGETFSQMFKSSTTSSKRSAVPSPVFQLQPHLSPISQGSEPASNLIQASVAMNW
jgi:hypothetical protein